MKYFILITILSVQINLLCSSDTEESKASDLEMAVFNSSPDKVREALRDKAFLKRTSLKDSSHLDQDQIDQANILVDSVNKIRLSEINEAMVLAIRVKSIHKEIVEKNPAAYPPTIINARCDELYANKAADAIIKSLLDAGGDVNYQYPVLGSLLGIATSHDNPDVVQTLLKAGADTEIANSIRTTPLQQAASDNNVVVLQLLIDGKAKVNAKSGMKDTALHFAVRAGHKEAVRKLLAAGADRTLRGIADQTPYDIAVKAANREIMALLLHDSLS